MEKTEHLLEEYQLSKIKMEGLLDESDANLYQNVLNKMSGEFH